MLNSKNNDNKEQKQKKQPDKWNKLISLISTIGGLVLIYCGLLWFGLAVFGVGLITNFIYEVIKSKKGGSD